MPEMGAGTWLVLSLVLWGVYLWAHWRILDKAGLNKWLIVLFVFPQVAIVGWVVLALIDWPPPHPPAGGSGRVKVYGKK